MSQSNSNVADFLLEGKPTDRIALHLLGEERTYGQLRVASTAFARYFDEIGCRKGDRVVLAGENSFFWVGAYLGILRAGLVCVPLSTTVTAEDLEHVLAVTESRVAAVQGRFAAKHAAHFRDTHLITEREIRGVPGLLTKASLAEIESRAPSVPTDAYEVQSHDPAALMFTSGSTGKPRFHHRVSWAHGSRSRDDGIALPLLLWHIASPHAFESWCQPSGGFKIHVSGNNPTAHVGD
jgi:acyl-coenzyme A synthetase/AMP-(fatty) acid ligase